MVKQWVQPPINKNRLPPGCFFFIRVPSHKFYSLFLLLRCSLEYYGKASKSSMLAISYVDFNHGIQ